MVELYNIMLNNSTKQRRLSDSEKIEVCKTYLLGDSTTILAARYKVSPPAIRGLLLRRGIKMRSDLSFGIKRYKEDSTFFDVIDTPNKAQILGLLYADGYHNEKRHYFVIKLTAKDKEYLEAVKHTLGSNKTLYYSPPSKCGKNKQYNGKAQYSLGITNPQLSANLTRLGVVQRKSLTLQFPGKSQVSEDMINHFLRGYFEGDGCLHISRKNMKESEFTLCGTQEFCIKVQHIFYDLLRVNSVCKQMKNKRINAYILRVRGNPQILKVMRWIYEDAQFYMARKYEKYMEFLNFFNTSKHDRSKQVEQYDLNNILIKTWDSAVSASIAYGLNDRMIDRICRSKNNMCKNFRWKYVD